MKDIKHGVVFFRLIFFLIILISSVSCVSSSAKKDKAQVVEQLIQSRIDKQGITGLTAAVVYGDQSIVTRGFGLRETVPEQLPVTEHTLFQIGSVTKIFTAIAIMQLEENGTIDLDADIRTYLPEFHPKSFGTVNKEITIRNLLTHHSGLPSAYFKDFTLEAPDPDAFMDTSNMLSEEYMVWDSGTVFAYNNSGFSLLGELIGRVSGSTYEEYITDHIFTPLGMHDSLVMLSSKDEPNVSGGFTRGEPEDLMWFIKDIPAGSILLSAVDMDTFLRELLNCSAGKSNRILQPETLLSMFSLQNMNTPLDGSFKIGLTFWIESQNGCDVFEHGGTIPPFYSEMEIIPEKGIGIFLASNDNAGDNDQLTSLTMDIADLLIGKKPSPSSPLINTEISQETDLSDLAGYYVNGGTGIVSIENIDGVLTGRIPEMDVKSPMKILSDNSIAFGDTGLVFKPTTDTDKAVFLCYMGNYFMGPVSAVSPEPVSSVWRQRTGRYEGAGFIDAVDLSFDEKMGVLTLLIESETDGNMRFALTELSDDLLKVQGYGRNMGNIIEYSLSESGEILKYGGCDFVKRN
ncbi:serine hydrolase domain-containing protein [Sediminispirochaeta smaragdinae]|uniref:Beta-lactamase n=1 Tax=Sediminispirochaeta smaragdinae (strain DSM 11293 / JCM 15392 / SEBR 4228) TaxID=573413 RepID=E1R4B9_SEDSS|nr:serine hydrolase domain-containing protein [Sediminispirochaeta smaragdinae]ADK81660.1 beta-lactamase [Sediminispirochaeta smaragdinae DSM 11293]